MKRFISAILVTIIALISLSGCLGKGGDYVAEIGNTKISRGEFMVYLIERKKKPNRIIDYCREVLFTEAKETNWNANVWYLSRFCFDKMPLTLLLW